MSSRVLHVYAGNLYGGVEAFLVTLARCSAQSSGFVHEYALCFEGRLSEALREASAAVHPLGAARFRRPWTVLAARRRLARLLAERAPDVVLCHGSWSHAVFAPAVVRAGARLGFWLHDALTRPHWVDRLASWAPPALALTNSRFTAAALPRLFPGVPGVVVPCPVAWAPTIGTWNEGLRAAVRRELGTPSHAVVIIVASRLEPLKGHHVLIAALGALKDRPGWEAWVVGGAQRPHERVYLKDLEAAVARAGLGGRVRFLGQRSDVPRLLAAADVHCQPNTGPEGFGIAFVEALYAGLPVVTTGIGGALEIVTPDCGILVAPNDAAGLTRTLDGLMTDHDQRLRLGSAGPARARALCDPGHALERLAAALATVR